MQPAPSTSIATIAGSMRLPCQRRITRSQATTRSLCDGFRNHGIHGATPYRKRASQLPTADDAPGSTRSASNLRFAMKLHQTRLSMVEAGRRTPYAPARARLVEAALDSDEDLGKAPTGGRSHWDCSPRPGGTAVRRPRVLMWLALPQGR